MRSKGLHILNMMNATKQFITPTTDETTLSLTPLIFEFSNYSGHSLHRIPVFVSLVLINRSLFDFEIGILDFAIEREIRKRISPLRNPSSRWISIKKSKSGFHGFPFHRFIGNPKKEWSSFC